MRIRAIESAEVHIFTERLTVNYSKIQQLEMDIATKAKKLNSLVGEVEELHVATQRLIENAHQEVDLNKVRYEQVASVTRTTREIKENYATVRQQLQEKITLCGEKRREVRDMRSRVVNLHRIEVARKAWATLLQGILVVVFIWAGIKLVLSPFS